MNKRRNIPNELTEEETLLYKYSQGVTLKLLQSIKEKYGQLQEISETAPSEDSMAIGEPDPFPVIAHA